MDKFRSFVLGRGNFKSAHEITQLVENSRDFNPAEEDISRAKTLLIFQTSRQHTWLVATNKRLYCVLDDTDKRFSRLQWSMPMDNIYRNGEFVAEISTRDKSSRTGLLNINERKNWLYSKELFTRQGIEENIRKLVEEAIKD